MSPTSCTDNATMARRRGCHCSPLRMIAVTALICVNAVATSLLFSLHAPSVANLRRTGERAPVDQVNSVSPGDSTVTCELQACTVTNLYLCNQRWFVVGSHLRMPGAPLFASNKQGEMQARLATGLLGHEAYLTLTLASDLSSLAECAHRTFQPAVGHTSIVSAHLANVGCALTTGAASWCTWRQHYPRTKHATTILITDVARDSMHHALAALAFGTAGVRYADEMKGVALRFEHASIGIGSDCQLPTWDLLPVQGAPQSVTAAYREYTTKLQQTASAGARGGNGMLSIEKRQLGGEHMGGDNEDIPCLLLTRNTTRRIFNLDDMLVSLARLGLVCVPLHLLALPLTQQVNVLRRANVLVSMHSSALALLHFAKPSATIIELLPLGYQSYQYANLATVLGLRFARWQNTDREATTFRSLVPVPAGGAAQAKVATPALHTNQQSFITGSFVPPALNHSDAASVAAWRDQDTFVDLASFTQLVSHALHGRSDSFLTYMPWEQLNNQLIELRCACVAAFETNRTLVVPWLGYRSHHTPEVAQWALADYEFQPMEQYLDANAMGGGMPCRTISLANFRSLRLGYVTRIHFDVLPFFWKERVAAYAPQAATWYHRAAGLLLEGMQADDVPIVEMEKGGLMEQEQLREYLNYPNERILALGVTFWLTGFGHAQHILLPESYESLMDNTVYAMMARSIVPRWEIVAAARSALTHAIAHALYTATGSNLDLFADESPAVHITSVHLRRGDYVLKCDPITEPERRASCWPNDTHIAGVVAEVAPRLDARSVSGVANGSPTLTPPAQLTSVLYIMSNVQWDTSPTSPNAAWMQGRLVLQQRDLVPFYPAIATDRILSALVDEVIGCHAHAFVGNYFSSFTRAVADCRDLRGSNYLVW